MRFKQNYNSKYDIRAISGLRYSHAALRKIICNGGISKFIQSLSYQVSITNSQMR